MPSIPFSQLTLKVIIGIVIYLGWQLNFFSLWQMGFSLQVSLFDSLMNAFVLALSSIAIQNCFRYYQPPPGKFWATISASAIFALLLAIGVKLLLPVINQNDVAYVNMLNHTTGIRIGFYIITITLMVVLSLFWNMMSREMESKNRKQESAALAREAELFKLRQQLQPHFLFNSLNSINALVLSRPQEARKMIEQLSTFLRSTIHSKDEDLVPLPAELEQLNRYLGIEKVRFGHRLKTVINCDESCNHAKLPPLLLQPIVENAIKFGLYDTLGEVEISIKASCTDNSLYITTSNPFDAETSSKRAGTGFGLSGIQRRLYLLFGRQDLLTTSSGNNQFITTIIIPQNYVSGYTDR